MTLEQMMLLEELMTAKIKYNEAKNDDDTDAMDEQARVVFERRKLLYATAS